MSEVRTFFRHCPQCGRRFEIRLVSKEPTGLDSESFSEKEEFSTITAPVPPYRQPLLINEEMPIVADVEEFRYHYKCKHCGHEWVEIHEKTTSKPRPEGYTGD
ncbi:MAG TPA: hypothetical protein VKF39_04605 [Nitrososphaerales archaeon]|nr:hypothetical protein [Nitrososphaerales archaeon]